MTLRRAITVGMTDVSKRARVDKGIPAGGQFAAEHRDESASSASLEVSKGLRGSEDFERVADDFEFHLGQHPIDTDREDEMREHLAHGVLSDESQASLQACLAADPGDDDAIDRLATSVLRDLNRTSDDPSERAFAMAEPTPAGAAWTERTITDEREFHAGRLEGPERTARMQEQKDKWAGQLAEGRANGNSTQIGISLAINEVLDNAERDGLDTEIERWQKINDESRGTNQTAFGMSRNILEVLTTVRDGKSAV